MRRRYLLVLGACAIFVAFWQVTVYYLQVMAARPRDNTRIVERPRVIPLPRTSLASGRLSVSPHHQSQPATPTTSVARSTIAVALGLPLPLNTAVKSVDPSSPCQHEPGSSSVFKAWGKGRGHHLATRGDHKLLETGGRPRRGSGESQSGHVCMEERHQR